MAPEIPEGTSFESLARVVKELEATRGKLDKRSIIARFLRGLKPSEVAPVVLFIIGRIFSEADQRALNVGWSTVRKALGVGRQLDLLARPLTISDVKATLDRIASFRGPDSARQRTAILQSLLGRASEEERDILVRMIFGEMRIGVSEGVMLEAIADAASVEVKEVRPALMLSGDLGNVAEIALSRGGEGLASLSLRVFTPIKPMLAEMAGNFEEVLKLHGGRTAVEFKFDGARVQIHRRSDNVRIYSRRLTEVTSSLSEIVGIARSLSASDFVVEGEVVAVDKTGKPLPFQDLMRRFRRVREIGAAVSEIPLKLYLFDCLYLNGRSLVNQPYAERWEALVRLVPDELLARRKIVNSVAELDEFLREALDAGHEGLIAKQMNSEYTIGKRGKRWLKIKPAETMDVVIVAAEWGHGRRTGTLSNYHLAVRSEKGFAMIGKTFKGLTDEERYALTEELLNLKTSESGITVFVRPEVVVEVTYNEIQKSPNYPSGYALRFARITRIRDDKGPGDADTYERLSFLYDSQFKKKGRIGR